MQIPKEVQKIIIGKIVKFIGIAYGIIIGTTFTLITILGNYGAIVKGFWLAMYFIFIQFLWEITGWKKGKKKRRKIDNKPITLDYNKWKRPNYKK